MKREQINIAGKAIDLYMSDVANAPVLYSLDYEKEADEILAVCKEIECPAFHLVSITGIRWDEELSPWAHAPVVSPEDRFTGEADAFLNTLETEIVPTVQKLIPNATYSLLNGYSMGGLFALYAAHHSTAFDAYIAPSGSVWYPGFVDYVKEHELAKVPLAIYLSLGDRESRTRNEYLQQTETNMMELQSIYEERKVASVFELNKGNHFKNIPKRVAKGIKWTLDRLFRV